MTRTASYIQPDDVDKLYSKYIEQQRQTAWSVSTLQDVRRRLVPYVGRVINNTLLKAFDEAPYKAREIYNHSGELCFYASQRTDNDTGGPVRSLYITLGFIPKGTTARPRLDFAAIDRQLETLRNHAAKFANCDIQSVAHRYNIIAAEYNKSVKELFEIPGAYDVLYRY